MNRILRGAVVLAASGLVWACNTEPEAVEGGTPDKIVSDPAVLFVPLGSTKEILFRLVDQQGTSLSTEFDVTPGAAIVAVEADTSFRPVYGPNGVVQANTNNTELRLEVTANALGTTTITITGEGKTLSIPVTVTPVSITPVLSNAAPSVAEPVTVTAEAGLTFSAGSQLVDAAGVPVAYTVGVAPDGTSMTVVFLPGTSGDFRITNVIPAYAPALGVDLPSTVTFATAGTIGAGLTGTDAIATAPTLTPANNDNTVGVVDVGTSFAGASGEGDGARYYKLIVEEDGHYGVTITWPGGKDLGVFLYDTDGAYLGISGDAGGLDDGTENFAADLVAGTYYIGVVYFNYGAQPLPETIQVDVAVE